MNTPGTEVHLILERAEAVGRRSQRGVWGSGEILLALLEGPSNTAADALRKLGVDRDAAADELLKLRPPAPDEAEPRRGNEVDYLMRQAASIAALRNDSQVNVNHMLLGVLWERDSAASRVLEVQGVRYEDCYRAIFDEDPPPELTPSRLAPASLGEPITIARDDLLRVLAHLEASLAVGERHAFNLEGDKAVVWADGRVDLAEEIRKALAEPPRAE